MKRLLAPLACAMALSTLPIGASAQGGRQAPAGTRVGMLTCDLSAGVGLIVTSSRTMVCRFAPRRGRAETYTGTVRRFGLDIGATTRTRMAWEVVTPVRRLERGSLEGRYVGVSAEGTLGVGAGANVLVGGSNDSISLQPLSVQAQRGLNLAAGVSEFTLDYAR